MAEETLDRELLKEIVKDHPDWKPDRIRLEYYFQMIRRSPTFIDDASVYPGGEDR